MFNWREQSVEKTDMERNYLDEVTELLKRARPKLDMQHQLEFKNVFGAVGGYVDGRIFISCGAFGIALRLPPKTLEKLFTESGVQSLKYFPKGHIKKEYAVLPKRITEDNQRLRKLVDESIRHALLLKNVW
jgi:TfoX/Sxy family transcriptional regulator of competence genes